jgi:hypothetical protein
MLLQGWVCTQVFEGHSHYIMQVGGWQPRSAVQRSEAAVAVWTKAFWHGWCKPGLAG